MSATNVLSGVEGLLGVKKEDWKGEGEREDQGGSEPVVLDVDNIYQHRQRLLVQEIQENVKAGSPLPMSQVIRNAGYSDSVASRPSSVLAKPSFRDLLEKMLPDQKLLDTHADLLDNAESENVRMQTLRMAYDLKGHLQPTIEQHNSLTMNFIGQPQPTEKQVAGEFEASQIIEGETADATANRLAEPVNELAKENYNL